MLYTKETKKAMRTAYKAHHDQLDRGGVPYIFHLAYVAEQMNTEELVCVALLHDVLEDTSLTAKDLRVRGFSKPIILAVEALTRKQDDTYQSYIEKVKENNLARKVKTEDLKHNMDMSRLKKVTEKDKKRKRKYDKALLFLEE